MNGMVFVNHRLDDVIMRYCEQIRFPLNRVITTIKSYYPLPHDIDVITILASESLNSEQEARLTALNKTLCSAKIVFANLENIIIGGLA